jgi:hypothetical protein
MITKPKPTSTRLPGLLVFALPAAEPVAEAVVPAVPVVVEPDEPVELAVDDAAIPLEVDLVTVAGILEPLTDGKTVNVVQAVPETSGQVSFRSNPLSSGPVGPVSYFHVTFKFSKFTCTGSESGYCLSPHLPRKYSQEIGVLESEGTNVPLVSEVGVKA